MNKTTDKENQSSLSCIVNDQGILKIPLELLKLIGIHKEEGVMIIPGKDHLKIYTNEQFIRLFGNY